MITTAATAALIALTGTPALAAVDYFLKIEGVEGEATHADHKGWIEILSIGGTDPAATEMDGNPDRALVTGQVTNPTGATQGSSAGRSAQHNQSDLEFLISRADKAAATLKQACSQGRALGRVELHRVIDGRLAASHVFYGVRCAELKAGAMHIMAPAPALTTAPNAVKKRSRVRSAGEPARSVRGDAARTSPRPPLPADPTIRLHMACREWIDHTTQRRGPACPDDIKAGLAPKSNKAKPLKAKTIKQN